MPLTFNPITGKLDIISDPQLKKIPLADDAYIDIKDASTGYGELIVGDNEERARFSWTTAGVVTLMENTANVVNTDTDGKFCIFDNGTSVRIRNRLGSTKTVKYVLNI